MERPQRTVLVLTGLLFTIVLVGIDTTIVSTVVPAALPELGDTHLYAWTFAAYMLATAVTMPVWGPGSDRWGRKRTFLLGVSIFILGSLACAAAPDMKLFIAARALQGVGAGAVVSLPFIVLGVVFPREKRGKALGIVSSAWAIASVAGPLLGTVIVTHVSWRWAFLLNLPVGILALALVSLGMRESVGERAGRFDLAGSLLAGAGGGLVVWGATQAQGGGAASGVAAIAAGIAVFALFVWHEGRAARPILPLSFFRHRGYAASVGASFLTFFAGFGLASYLPIVADARFGTPRAVGLVVGAFTIGWSLVAFGSGRILHRVGERSLALGGVAVHGVGLVALALAIDRGLGFTLAAAVVAGAGMGALTPALTVVVQNSVDVRQMGSATTSVQFLRQLGGAVGVAVFVLAASVAGFRAGLSAMGVATALAFAFALFLPASSLAAPHATPAEGAS